MQRLLKRFMAFAALAAAMAFPAAGAEVQLTPAGDVQKALDAATPGDTIVLDDGVYYQNLLITRGGTPGKPVTLRAAHGGAATLSGAVPPDQGKLKFELVEGDLYKAAVSHRVWWTMAGARNLVNYGTLEHLKKFQFPNLYKPDNALQPCATEGFAWEDGTLYVRLEGGVDPKWGRLPACRLAKAGKMPAPLEIHRPGGHSTAEPEFADEFYCNPDTGFWVPGSGHLFSKSLANVIVKADHVVIEGLRLHMGVGAAVVVHGNQVTVRDCYMSGTHMGVCQPDEVKLPAHEAPHERPIGRANRTSRGLTVEYCEFSCYPAFQWCPKYWNGLYHSNLAAVFMNYGGPRSIVRHNWIYDSANDLLQPRGNGTSSPQDAGEIAYNLIQNCGDDSIEFDSTTPMNLRVHHNVIMDSLCLLAISPVMGGRLTIDHNILYVSPENGFEWCGLFKGGSPWGSGLPTRGVRIVHNTMVNTKGQSIGLWWVGGHRYENNVIENNIFYVARSQNFSAPGLVFGRHNLYCGLKVDSSHIPEMMHYDGSPFVSMKPMDFTLRPDGPAVDAGVAGKDYHHQPRGKAPDLGAIELGETWQFPAPGPRWAKGNQIANRPFSVPVEIGELLRRPRMPRLDRPVRVDGALEEWGEPAIALSGPTSRWHGPADQSVKVYWGSDGEALYVAAEVTDDRHANAQKADLIWNGDALQMGLVAAEDVHWNIGLALTKEGIAFHQWAGKGHTLPKTAEYTVVRDDDANAKTTRYELRLPLATLGLEPGAVFGFNIVFFDDDDGNGQRHWLQLAPGLAGLHDVTLYPRFVLAK